MADHEKRQKAFETPAQPWVRTTPVLSQQHCQEGAQGPQLTQTPWSAKLATLPALRLNRSLPSVAGSWPLPTWGQGEGGSGGSRLVRPEGPSLAGKPTGPALRPPIFRQMNTQGAHLTLLPAPGPQQWVETHHPCPRGASAGGQEGWGGESRGRVRG